MVPVIPRWPEAEVSSCFAVCMVPEFLVLLGI